MWEKLKETSQLVRSIYYQRSYHLLWLVYLYHKWLGLIIYTSDKSLTWFIRIVILVLFGFVSYQITPFVSDHIISSFVDNIDIITGDNMIFASSVTIFIFVLIFGFGHWIIKTHDTKKQFKDNFRQCNEVIQSNAIDLVTQGDKAKCVIGLIELTMLRNNNLIDNDRCTRITASLSLANAQLNDVHLKEVYLGGIDLRNANLENAELQNANLLGTNLEGANLNGAQLYGIKAGALHLKDYLTKRSPRVRLTRLLHTSFKNASLEGANLDLMNFRFINITGCRFCSASLTRTNFENMELRNVDFSGADLGNSNLQRTRLVRASLKGTNLKGAKLRRLILIHTNLVDANLSDTDLREINVAISFVENHNGSKLQSLPLASVADKSLLQGAKYNSNTKFSNGFDPQRYGMEKVT